MTPEATPIHPQTMKTMPSVLSSEVSISAEITTQIGRRVTTAYGALHAALDRIRGTRFTELAQHERGSHDRGEGVGDVLPCDVRCGAVHGLVQADTSRVQTR